MRQRPVGEILLVDDDPAIRALVHRGLSAVGYTVLDAPHGADALHLLERHAFDIRLVITDVQMPVMDGVALARTIRRRWPRLPIIFMSGAVDPGDVAELGWSEVRFLAKPFDWDVLDAAVRQVLGPGSPGMPEGLPG